MQSLSPEQRQAIDQEGVPLPLGDDVTGEVYMLLPVEFVDTGEPGNHRARIPSISAFGEGETAEEAVLALAAALDAYMDAFGD